MNKKFLIIIFSLIITSVCSTRVDAQQTIINVPSSEVLPLGDVIFKESTKFSSFYSDTFATITPSATFGTGHGTEISTGVSTALDANTVVRGDFSAKKVWFLGGANRLTAGVTMSPYLNQHTRPNTFAFAHFTHRIKETKTSLTAGGYVAGYNDSSSQGGVLFGLEQVIIPNKLRLAFDWLSGNESQGRLGVGVKYRPVPTLSVTSAIIVPNDECDDVGFNISLSKFISLKDYYPTKRRL